MFSKSNILKISLFATGLSGIVAEYVLATLATYFLGNSVLQWTMILSVMLFSMGLGSRVSQYINKNILEKFIITEFLLSILVAFCVILAYLASAYASFNDSLSVFPFPFDGTVIYVLSIAIGFMIGLEIPMVTRLNEEFEELKVNIANVMEKDYYGSLAGGIFFAFIGLPIFGLTYTPFILGSVNLLVATLLLFVLWKVVSPTFRKGVLTFGIITFCAIGLGAAFAGKVINLGEQKRYKDRVIYQEQTPYQRIVLTRWQNHHWFYLNGNLQLSTYDEWLYHEPLVHPVMRLSANPKNVLVLGGGDGCAVREILKYPSVEKITLVDLDSAVTSLARKHPVFSELNQGSLESPKLEIIHTDAFNYLEKTLAFYDVMIIDFPDPKTIQLSRLFSEEFFRMCYNHLRPNGLMITQSGSPYYATKAFYCVEKTVQEAGFTALPIHNQVLSLGEWGWVIGSKSMDKNTLKKSLQQLKFNDIQTKWLTSESMQQITSFGKSVVPMDSSQVEINRIHNPVLPEYYRKGNWDIFGY